MNLRMIRFCLVPGGIVPEPLAVDAAVECLPTGLGYVQENDDLPGGDLTMVHGGASHQRYAAPMRAGLPLTWAKE